MLVFHPFAWRTAKAVAEGWWKARWLLDLGGHVTDAENATSR
jgi:hypothetical protein